MDESTKQLLEEVRAPRAGQAGAVERYDYEYRRNGVGTLFLAFEPLGGWRQIRVTERRTRQDWAGFIKDLLDNRYAEAYRVVLVMDNLNTHSGAPFSVLQQQCLDRRIANSEILQRETAAWETQRNQAAIGANWKFTTEDARVKLRKLYPSFLE